MTKLQAKSENIHRMTAREALIKTMAVMRVGDKVLVPFRYYTQNYIYKAIEKMRKEAGREYKANTTASNEHATLTRLS